MTVGLFFPLPEHLAREFPSLGEEDDSPSHVTFLYVGEGPEPEDVPRFLDVVRSEVQNWPWRVTASLMGLEYFHNPEHTVAYDRVSFYNDMAPLRVSMLRALEANGFTVEDSHPLDYNPHATLAYLPPGDSYQGDVPRGSWTFNTVEVWGLGDDPVELPVGQMASRVAMAVRVAARYKSKKKIKTKDGDETTVYEYSDRQVANRHREKAERVEHLRKHMSDLRARVKSDLKSDDPETRMTALAVSLMDHTCERVGNDESADEGHFGVTGWLVEHVTIKGDKATIKYVGKSGVGHEKTVEDGPTVTALKELTKGRKGKDAVFDTEDARVTSECVNDYLAEFDITAKDIRGFRANDEMCKALREERSKGPKTLPKGRKEKDEILKAEFKRALETVAEVVGHEASTLRSQYLVPGLEDQFIKDGTVLKSLKVGTKTHSEREDESAEALVKPAPKKKPPRHDLRRERIEVEDSDTDTSDDDLSLNYKDAAVRVAMAVMVAHRVFTAAQKDEDEFQKWVEGKQFTHPKTHNDVEFGSLPLDEQKRVRKKWTKKVRKDPDEEIPVEHEEPEDDIPVEHGDLPKASQAMRESITREIGSAGSPLPKSTASGLDKVLEEALDGQDEAFAKGLAEACKAQAREIMDRGAEEMANDDPVSTTVPKGMYSVEGDDEDGDGESTEEFNPKKSAKQIGATIAARDKLSDTVAQATTKIQTLKDKLKDTSAAKAGEVKAALKDAEETLNKASSSLKSHNNALTRMVAYHAGMTHLIAHLSDPTRLSRNTYSGPTDDDSTTSEDKLRATAVYEYQSLPSHVVEERRARAETRLKEVEEELNNLPPSQVPSDDTGHPYREPHTSDRSEKLLKEKEALDNDILAAKFVEITRGATKGETDKATEIIRRFKSKGINDPHLQHLLKHGMSGEGGQKAVHNLLQGMDDDELGKFVGDEGADLHEMLSGLDPRKSWAGAARRDLRKDLINRMLFSEGAFDSDDDDGERGITQMVGNARNVGQSLVKNNVSESRVRRWWNGLRDILKKDKRVELPEATSNYSLKDLFQKLNPKNFWKGRSGKTAGIPSGPQPSRVATRYLAYPKLVR